jgi:hypothetical protein
VKQKKETLEAARVIEGRKTKIQISLLCRKCCKK